MFQTKGARLVPKKNTTTKIKIEERRADLKIKRIDRGLYLPGGKRA